MSQLSKAIVATDTGERKHIPQKLSPLIQNIFSSKAEIQETISHVDIGVSYRIGCNIGARVTVSEYERMRNPDALDAAIMRAKRQVIEGVFGEFRPHFRQIEIALYNYDYTEAARLLHEMEYLMFELE